MCSSDLGKTIVVPSSQTPLVTPGSVVPRLINYSSISNCPTNCLNCESLFVGVGGDTYQFYIGGSCDGPVLVNDIQGQTQIAKTWMDNIADWMNGHGYSGATGSATPPSEPFCTACVGPNCQGYGYWDWEANRWVYPEGCDCDLWGSATFGVGGVCCGTLGGKFINEPPWVEGILNVFDGQVFPGQNPPFYWQSVSKTDIPTCCHGPCEDSSECLPGCDCVDGTCTGSNPFI